MTDIEFYTKLQNKLKMIVEGQMTIHQYINEISEKIDKINKEQQPEIYRNQSRIQIMLDEHYEEGGMSLKTFAIDDVVRQLVNNIPKHKIQSLFNVKVTDPRDKSLYNDALNHKNQQYSQLMLELLSELSQKGEILIESQITL